ncbi:MAG: DMT family transporter [Chloroflexota bacterium]|nr:DMT family transporter [Chloroflexota bacterium]
MGSDLAAAILGLISAASWGAADFSGGIASKRANAFVVVAASQGAGLVLLVCLALLFGQPVPSVDALLWGGGAGLLGGLGLAALYRALASGQMGVAAPVTAVLSAALPVLFAAIVQGAPGPLQVAGFGAGLLGIWLLSRPAGSGGRPRGLGLALLAGAGFGGFLILIHQAGEAGFLWALASARVASLGLMLVIVLATARRDLPQTWRGLWVPVLLAGILDVGGNAFFVLAAGVGRLDVAAVLSSLYPASTVLLARLVLKERLTRTQAAGIGVALLAIPLIAAT